jgi:hypothetical protein
MLWYENRSLFLLAPARACDREIRIYWIAIPSLVYYFLQNSQNSILQFCHLVNEDGEIKSLIISFTKYNFQITIQVRAYFCFVGIIAKVKVRTDLPKFAAKLGQDSVLTYVVLQLRPEQVGLLVLSVALLLLPRAHA